MVLNPTHLLMALTLMISSMAGAVTTDDSTEALDARTVFGDDAAGDDTVRDRVMDRHIDRLQHRAEKLEMMRDNTVDKLMMLTAYAKVENRSLGDEDLANATARTAARLAIIDACLADDEDCQMRDLQHRMKARKDHAPPAFDERLDMAERRATITLEMVDACRDDADCTVSEERLDEMQNRAGERLRHIDDCRADLEECKERKEQRKDRRHHRGDDRQRQRDHPPMRLR